MEACKKRRRCPKIFSFHPSLNPATPSLPPPHSATTSDPSSVSVRSSKTIYVLQNNPFWGTLLVSDKSNLMAPLFTLEKQVSQFSHLFCDHCYSAVSLAEPQTAVHG
ncbi:hypothetical protein PIB30_074128 [Stylosanthes scabra]|uniref:Uncharacterized protein n=1 Tax=Stylosanthes scabra TaxID=79078 RepID=A0ABU6UNC1_9FABA|nr:hypothetical protein [Stylosanthes scabra]